MAEEYVVRVYADKTVKSKVTDRMKKLREEIEKLPKEKIEKIMEAITFSDKKISIKRKLDILFSEMSEDPDDEPGLIYIERVESVLRKVRQEK